MPDEDSKNENQHKAINEWAYKYLSTHGYTIKNNLPETVQNTPWSYVIRYFTAEGYIYLKHTPELLALEANVIQILDDQFQASVPKLIARNVGLNCFLMKDAGTPLRQVLKKKFDETLLCNAVDQFTSLQLTIADHINIFFDIGVPDWRLDKLPGLYQQLLLQKAVLIEDGLSEIEIIKLQSLAPKVANLCNKLSGYSIKQSIVQPDFHDNNILINERSQNITFIDLGEVVISHPFFSLINYLDQIRKHHALTEQDGRYVRIRNACFNNYLQLNANEHILEAFKIARTLLFIYGALTSYRLMIACDKKEFRGLFQRHARPSIQLKEFLAVCSN